MKIKINKFFKDFFKLLIGILVIVLILTLVIGGPIFAIIQGIKGILNSNFVISKLLLCCLVMSYSMATFVIMGCIKAKSKDGGSKRDVKRANKIMNLEILELFISVLITVLLLIDSTNLSIYSMYIYIVFAIISLIKVILGIRLFNKYIFE